MSRFSCNLPFLEPKCDPRWRIAWVVVPLLVVSSAPLCGHSMWPDLHSARTWISCAAPQNAAVSEGQGAMCRLRVVVTVEVPVTEMILAFRERYADLDLAAELRAGRIEELEAEFRNTQFETISDGLTVAIDGQPTPGRWRPTDRLGNGYGLQGFFSYELVFEPEGGVTISSSTRAIAVTNRNFEYAEIMFANVVDPVAPLTVTESSSIQPVRGVVLEEGSEAEIDLWSAEQSRRVFHVVVAAQP